MCNDLIIGDGHTHDARFNDVCRSAHAMPPQFGSCGSQRSVELNLILLEKTLCYGLRRAVLAKTYISTFLFEYGYISAHCNQNYKRTSGRAQQCSLPLRIALLYDEPSVKATLLRGWGCRGLRLEAAEKIIGRLHVVASDLRPQAPLPDQKCTSRIA